MTEILYDHLPQFPNPALLSLAVFVISFLTVARAGGIRFSRLAPRSQTQSGQNQLEILTP